MKKTLCILVLTLLSACSEDKNGNQSTPVVAKKTACGDVQARPWCNTALTPDERTALLLSHMSIDQKIKLLTGGDFASVATSDPYTGVVFGIPELGIPDLRMSDGPVGVRGGQTTAMPTPIALGASFNPEIAYAVGQTIANEVKHKGNDLLHGPVADLIRNPIAGRGFETMGEDPWLTTRLVVDWIEGAQSQGVMANLKHYLANHQEGQVGLPPLVSLVGGRHLVNAVIDERTLRELYLPPFEAAVKEAKVSSLMCAYNFINGEPACSSKYLLQDVLKDEWGFNGFIVSDYIFAVKDTVKTIQHGSDIEMPAGFFMSAPLVKAALATNAITEENIDHRVGAILRTLFEFNFFDRERFIRDDNLIDKPAHAAVALEAAEQGMVLLKNHRNVLPLNDDIRQILVIGTPALERPSGGGSSSTVPFQFISPLEAIKARAGSTTVIYDDGSDANRAATLATKADATLVFVADRATEGTDKLCLRLDCSLADLPDPISLNALGPQVAGLLNVLLDPVLQAPGIRDILGAISTPVIAGSTPIPGSAKHQDGLIGAVAKKQPNTIVVMQTSATVLTPWREDVAGILEAWYPGQEGGRAIARVLFGDTDPGGRLPVSFPKNEFDTPVGGKLDRYPGILNQARHNEGVFIGYRWHDSVGIAPAFPFGHGLSYTSFLLSDLAVQREANQQFVISARMTNIGKRAGWGVPQLYVSLPSPSTTIKQPPVVLKGFSKHFIQPGQTVNLNFKVTTKDLSYWDIKNKTWQFAPGCYEFSLGQSSRNRTLFQGLSDSGSHCVSNL